MAEAVILSLLLVLSTTLFHFSVLRWLSGGMARFRLASRTRILVIIFSTFVAHIAEIALYAAAYFVTTVWLSLGTFSGLIVEGPLDYFYYSIVTYTSLGLGDVYPSEHLRFVSGVETLNGLLLIAWSGSFIYLAMTQLWRWQKCTGPDGPVNEAD